MKILRKRFGNLNAIKNISEYTFAPKIDAVIKSLIKPVILENKIPLLFVKTDLNSFILLLILKPQNRYFYE